MGSSRSDGPLGLDPFGLCPNNPFDGKPLRPGKTDYEDLVNQRINGLVSGLKDAERRLKAVEPDKLELAEELEETKLELAKTKRALEDVNEIIARSLGSLAPASSDE